ncbi:MAG: beta-galactosidase [Verrucomicrobia bacterium]|jgi:beta-galactosidase|nr:beta-galactosidase [Verrucomicrobiota bacterium]MBT7701892.1 beta-galactosidase [Verrucomicrobiota bacterium]
MTKRYQPINPKCTHMLHGGDYNPDQWIRTPEIWDEDMRLMTLSGCNAMSVCIFSWSALEPAEGAFEFGWLDTIMDKLAANNAYAVMATPSGSKPAWMSRAYPEICRVKGDGVRQPHGSRHNHCRTSPVYREKCVIINTKLAERYKEHPALLLWHASNEYNGGDCQCDLCLAAFHNWLRVRYDNDLDKLNHAYWSSFWSHSFPDWDYIIPTDRGIHALMLDWERFKTHQTIDFFNAETAPLRAITPDIPVTTNFMPGSDTLDYGAFAKAVDVISWDSYPNWHEHSDEIGEAVTTARMHDQCRAMKGGKPFMLMESVPSIPTRGRVKKRKEPGMNLLSSLQAVAHGSDTVQYFQWRKSRGCMEKFHGAVVDHEGSENTREFKEVADVGAALAKLDDVVGTTMQPEVALIQDWENEWALREGARVYLGENIKYRQEMNAHYRPFWQAGVPVDVVDQTAELDAYKLVVVPMAYMLRPGFAARLKAYVENGGTAVMTYWSAVVDESDLCHLGGIPGDGLRELFGVWEEESQSYLPGESVGIAMAKDNALGISGPYTAVDTCSVIHAEGSTVLASYASEYVEGQPALTVKTHGKGKAYYIAARTDGAFLNDFYAALARDEGLACCLAADIPEGVSVQTRSDGDRDYIFVMNFNREAKSIELGSPYVDVLTDQAVGATVTLERYGVMVLRKP